MSTVRLKTDQHGIGEAGEVVSVPFGKGKQLVADGHAEYPPQPAGRRSAAPDPGAEVAALRRQVAALQGDNARLKDENEELNALLAADPPAPGGEV